MRCNCLNSLLGGLSRLRRLVPSQLVERIRLMIETFIREFKTHQRGYSIDGHYALATFEAYKLLDKEVATLAKLSESGVKLMMKAFNEQSPLIRLTRHVNDKPKR